MVGHHRREHHEREAEVEDGSQRRVGAAHAHHLAADAVEEYHRVERCEQQYRRHDEDGAVDAREPHQSLIDEVGHVHEERQQRMAVDIIARRPVAHHAISDGVEARDVEL